MKISLKKKLSMTTVSLFTLGTMAFAAPALAGTGLEMPSGFEQPSAIEAFIPTVDTPTDITGTWAENDIKDMLALKAVKGYPDKTFRPDKSITRAELASVISNALYLPKAEEVELPDVSGSHWAAKVIANALPYLASYPDGSFRPESPGTREELAVAIVKATGLDKKVVDPTYLEVIFKDYKTVSPELKNLVAVAVDQKLIKGYTELTTDVTPYRASEETINFDTDGDSLIEKGVYITEAYAGTGGTPKDLNNDGDTTDDVYYNMLIKAQNFVTRAEMCNLMNNARNKISLGYKIPGGSEE